MKNSLSIHSRSFGKPSIWLVFAIISIGAGFHSTAQEKNQKVPEPKATPQETVEIQAREGDTVGWHLVQEGECLENITKSYLGYAQLWRENWRLNPGIKNPHKLAPGQRIRVITRREMTNQSAEVVKVRRQVERQTVPNPWTEATVGDKLIQRDSLRTFEDSFSELLFQDGTTLNVTEESMIFLRSVGQNLVGIHREAVEIINGQADLKGQFQTKKRSDIEIILGDAHSRPKPDVTGHMATRNRMRQEGQAEVMVFSGSAQVESAGATVEVQKGMGTVISRGEAPKAPTKLLAKPQLQTPVSGAKFKYRNPSFTWSEVSGASRYTFEIFDDAQCTQLVQRHTGISETQWTANNLDHGHLYWQVTATDALGLDGFPSSPRPFDIAGNLVDTSAPTVVALRIGAGQIIGDQIILGAGASVKLFAHDDASGVSSVRYRWDEAPWQDYGQQNLTLPTGKDRAMLEFQAVDALGSWSEIQAVTVSQDIAPPQSPTIKR